ncbi:MAG: hypothetical protein EZS28_049934, partial [Streblomastix strix]
GNITPLQLKKHFRQYDSKVDVLADNPDGQLKEVGRNKALFTSQDAAEKALLETNGAKIGDVVVTVTFLGQRQTVPIKINPIKVDVPPQQSQQNNNNSNVLQTPQGQLNEPPPVPPPPTTQQVKDKQYPKTTQYDNQQLQQLQQKINKANQNDKENATTLLDEQTTQSNSQKDIQTSKQEQHPPKEQILKQSK